ncbi:MAG: GMC family oxidoreductase [Acidimicrobiia bacterium]
MALIDAKQVEQGSTVRADVCIVGGGPAGIALALSLVGSRLSVVLLESGGTTQDPDSKDLNVGVNAGLPYYDLDETRHRGLGGGSQRWAGWCRPLDRSDFEPRDSLAATGWPITYDDLLPFYDEAAILCEIEPISEDRPTSHLPAIYREPFVGGDVHVATWQGSPPTKFGTVYRDDLERATNVTVYTHATAIEVLTNDLGTATSGVRVVSPSGSEFSVAAPTVALCAGAIETARLLLASRSVHTNGIGNEYDLVGRNFMEHPHVVTARLSLIPSEVSGRPFVDGIDLGVRGVRDRLAIQRPSGSSKAAYVITPERRSKEGSLNFSTHLQTVSKINRGDSKTYQAFKLVVNNLRSPSQLASQVRSRSLPEGTTRQIGYLVRGLPELAQVVWEEALKRPNELALYTQCEQEPNPESRVMLEGRDVDASGLPRVELRWKLSRLDKESVMVSHEILQEHFLETGLGVLIPEPAFRDDSDDWGPNLRGGHHHMGTARMATDPRHGVVDADCRVHSVHGLFVGDSAVFPVSGYANPLLTTVAIARRLGAHLRASLAN